LDLHVIERGDPSRPTLLLVHGFPETSTTWAPLAALLSADFHVVAYDVRGAGASDAPDLTADYRLPLLVEDMAAVIDAVSPDAPVHLVAHDWGSIQGWEAVTSDRLSGRIASYTSISGPPIDHAGLWAREHLSWKPDDLFPALRQAMHSWYIVLFQLPFLPRLVTGAARLKQSMSADSANDRSSSAGANTPRSTVVDDFVHGLNLYRANVHQRFRYPTAGYTDTPVQIIVPLHDRFITPALLDGLEAWSSLVWRRDVNGGHWIIRTHPEELARWIRQVVAFVETGTEPEDLGRWRATAR
jgi:pimeloyl-ACP methyl ester carboxylesterase